MIHSQAGLIGFLRRQEVCFRIAKKDVELSCNAQTQFISLPVFREKESKLKNFFSKLFLLSSRLEFSLFVVKQ
jgi:hypothetical protein